MKQQNIPLEGSVVKGILAKLNALPGCRVKKFHGSPFGQMELDIYGTYRGLSVFIEAKRPGEHPTARQESEIRKWQAAGAISGVAHSVQEALELVLSGAGERLGARVDIK